MTSKAPWLSKTSNQLYAPMLHTVIFPNHRPIGMISALFATLIRVVLGDRALRQCPYASHLLLDMQFRMAPLSTWPVARTTVLSGPESWMRCRKGRVRSSFGSEAIVKIFAFVSSAYEQTGVLFESSMGCTSNVLL